MYKIDNNLLNKIYLILLDRLSQFKYFLYDEIYLYNFHNITLKL